MAFSKLILLCLLATAATSFATTFTVTKYASVGTAFDGGLLGSSGAIALAASGDIIVFGADFDIPRPLNILKSLTITGAGHTLGVTYTSGYGIYIKGSSAVTVTISDLTITGRDLTRGFQGIYVTAGSSKATVGNGPTVTIRGSTLTAFRLAATTNLRLGRGAALKAGTGAVVQILTGTVSNNFAPLSGAVEQAGGGFLYLCNVFFTGNTAGAGVAAADIWQGQNVQGASAVAIVVDQGAPTPVSGFNTTQSTTGPAAVAPRVVTKASTETCPPLSNFYNAKTKMITRRLL
eukprot:jgi/Mesen1/8370/ME000464S07762